VSVRTTVLARKKQFPHIPKDSLREKLEAEDAGEQADPDSHGKTAVKRK